jgi:hypothetical protein
MPIKGSFIHSFIHSKKPKKTHWAGFFKKTRVFSNPGCNAYGTLNKPALDDVLYEHHMDGGEEGGVLILQYTRVIFILQQGWQ